ncbi:MAG TPA: molybdenum cofactor guanylyltransferase [Vicinamibacterales bacterium]|jgi:molybdopterin-guanine dinucleotide biosynthesis protein A
MNPISAAILAGGRATRFGGADKASLVVGGRRIIDRQLELLAAFSDDVMVVVNDRTRYPDLDVPVVMDRVAGAGPLGGVYTALAEARHSRVIVLACDLPFVSPALLDRLVVASEPGRHEQDAVVPRTTRGLEPLAAVYRRHCAEVARRCIESGELRMTAFLAELRVGELDAGAVAGENEETWFENINTPHDYARARGRVELDKKPFEDRITE